MSVNKLTEREKAMLEIELSNIKYALDTVPMSAEKVNELTERVYQIWHELHQTKG